MEVPESMFLEKKQSPSMRREWIEIFDSVSTLHLFSQSPSMRREWIEISRFCENEALTNVSLHAEGVD